MLRQHINCLLASHLNNVLRIIWWMFLKQTQIFTKCFIVHLSNRLRKSICNVNIRKIIEQSHYSSLYDVLDKTNVQTLRQMKICLPWHPTDCNNKAIVNIKSNFRGVLFSKLKTLLIVIDYSNNLHQIMACVRAFTTPNTVNHIGKHSHAVYFYCRQLKKNNSTKY